MAWGTRAKFQLEILKRSTISAIYKFRENILESSWNVSKIPFISASELIEGHNKNMSW